MSVAFNAMLLLMVLVMKPCKLGVVNEVLNYGWAISVWSSLCAVCAAIVNDETNPLANNLLVAGVPVLLIAATLQLSRAGKMVRCRTH